MKYTEEQIKQIFADNSDCFADAEGQLIPIPAMTLETFVSSFKNAMELLQPPATKPLSEITDEDAIKVAKIVAGSNVESINHLNNQVKTIFSEHNIFWFLDLYRVDSATCLNVSDFLRSKGYILPTTKA